MHAWFDRVWNDEEAFKGLIRALIRWGGGAFGAILAMGWVPPGLSESGTETWKAGLAMMALFFGLPSKPLDPKARQAGMQQLLSKLPPLPRSPSQPLPLPKSPPSVP